MGIFQKKESFDIECVDRTLKNLIDKCYDGKPLYNGDYESNAIFYVSLGIKFQTLLMKMLDEEYAKHKKDLSYDIPNYKTFLSLEQTIRDNKAEYEDKTICIEGYVSHMLRPAYPDKWSRDAAAIWIYPLPCKTEAENEINHTLMDKFHTTRPITLVSDEELPVRNGDHIRVHGVPYFYKAYDGGTPAGVHVLVNEFEIIQ